MVAENKRIARLVAYLDALGIKADISGSYNDRVKVQKVAFLMDTLANELKYDDFNFRIKGPYSHTLTVEYFEKQEEFKTKSTFPLNDNEQEKIRRIKEAMNGSLDVESLEIVASLLYLHNKEGLGYDESEIETVKISQ